MPSALAMSFAVRLSKIFEVTKGDTAFLDELAASCDGFSKAVYERAVIKLRDTRKYRSIPMPAEAKQACEEANQAEEAIKMMRNKQEENKNEWSNEAALAFLRGKDLAIKAAKAGWIGPLVGFVCKNHRLPVGIEISTQIKIQRDFEKALLASSAGGIAGMWHQVGVAMANRQADWAAKILMHEKISG